MEIRDLRIFIAVSQQGSISRAAQQLHYVQSNVSARIKHLEQRLDTPLLHRKSKGVELTTSGHQLLDYAQRIIRLSEEAQNVIRDQQEPQGRLAIGSMETTAAIRLPSLLAAYHQRYPQVELNLTTGPSAESVQRLLNYQIDGALVSGEIDQQLFLAEKAFVEDLVLVTPQDFDPSKQLTKTTVLVFRAGCTYRAQLEHWLRDTGKMPYQIMEFGSIEGIIGCIGAGMGISFLPRSIVDKKHRQYCSLHTLPQDFGRMTTWFIRRRNERSTKAMQAFREMLIGSTVS